MTNVLFVIYGILYFILSCFRLDRQFEQFDVVILLILNFQYDVNDGVMICIINIFILLLLDIGVFFGNILFDFGVDYQILMRLLDFYVIIGF